jgi:hypothetical protein
MTTLEHDLDRLREQLRLAVAADLRRRARRRRRATQLAVVPALALTAGGVAVAVAPVLEGPAPPRVQRTFDDSLRASPNTPWVPEPGSKLRLWARDGDLALYGHVSHGGVCTLADNGAPASQVCSSQWERPRHDAIGMQGIGGATEREHNVATGQVGARDAVTVEISAPGVPNAARVSVGHDGWFVAQLPDSLLGSLEPDARPPELTVVASDASGTVVARWENIPRRQDARRAPSASDSSLP